MNDNAIHRRLFLQGGASLGLAGLAPAWAQGGPAATTTTGAPVRGGTLTVLIDPEPPTLTTIAHSAGSSVLISAKVTEGLLSYDFDLAPRPQLASAWSVSSDGLQYTCTLRRRVKWHDGRPFTSADVAHSIGLLKQYHPRGRPTFSNRSPRTTCSAPPSAWRSRPSPPPMA